jgi:hypothetical protein
MTETTPSPLGNVITIDDERIKSHSTAWSAVQYPGAD